MGAVFKKVPCVICGNILTLTGKANKHCQTEECITAFARRRAFERVEKVGECLVWQGPVQHKGGTPIVTLRHDNKRRDFRVLALRDPEGERATYRRYHNLCGTDRCVEVEHHKVQIGRDLPPPQLIRNHLPWEPLVEWIKERNITIGEDRHRPLQTARSRGFITVTAADEFCIDVLGVHPASIYGELFFTA